MIVRFYLQYDSVILYVYCMIFVDIWFKQNKYKRMYFVILDFNKVENWKFLRKLN